MIFLLDTNVCIHLLNKKHSIIQQHFQSHSTLDIFLCSVVKAELLYGARRSERVEANLALLNAFLRRCKVCTLTIIARITMGKFTLIF